MPPDDDRDDVALSQCGVYKTDDGTPYGRITEVLCPDKTNCPDFVPLVDGRLDNHQSSKHCDWVGARFIDDRPALKGHKFFNRAGITALADGDARTQATGRL